MSTVSTFELKVTIENVAALPSRILPESALSRGRRIMKAALVKGDCVNAFTRVVDLRK